MIPKRAIFYWSGGEMSWLRKQGIDSFKLHNPDWKVEVYGGKSSDSLLAIVQCSDLARYTLLATGGGFYFDTDILFVRPIPDEWLKHELILPFGQDGALGHIAALGSVPGSPFFKLAVELVAQRRKMQELVNYQGYGVHLLRDALHCIGSTDVKWIEHDRFCFVPHWDVAQAWNPWPGAFPEMVIGVHWYGGDPLSRDMEAKVDEAWMDGSSSLIARAWRASALAAR